jgi:hypothetical protein
MSNGLVADPIPPVYQANILDEINDPTFVPKRFTSSKSAVNQVSDTPLIDLTVDATPPVVQVTEDPKSIFHTSVSVVRIDFTSIMKEFKTPAQEQKCFYHFLTSNIDQ